MPSAAGPLGRAEHLDIDRALGARRWQVGIEDIAEIARRAQRRRRPGRRWRGSSGSPSRHSGRRSPNRPGGTARGRCGPPARAPARAGSSLRDGNAVRPWESRKSSQRQVGPLQPVVGRILRTPVDQVQAHRHDAAGPTGWARWHAAAAHAARPAMPRRDLERHRLGCPATASHRASRSPAHRPTRRKRWRNGPRWPPGSAIRQPLSRSASSSAIQKPVTVTGVGVQVGRVLVPADLAADLRLLEDVHRLQQQRLRQAQRRGQRCERAAGARCGRTPGRGRAARGRSCSAPVAPADRSPPPRRRSGWRRPTRRK